MPVGGISGGRNLYGEHRSVAFLPIGGAYRAPVQLYKLAHNGQPQSQASTSSIACVCLAKAFEYMGQEVLVDTGAIVDDRDRNIGPILLQADLDFAVLETKPDGVRKEIPNDLTKSIRIPFDVFGTRWPFHNEPDSFGIGLRSQGVNCGLNQGMNIDGPSL